jgi:NAD+ synthase (glutamine-hydrolysing)
LLIRPKKFLANDGNYREMRWFTPWTRHGELDTFTLPVSIATVLGQLHAPFGDGIIRTNAFTFGTELCEELFTPLSPHIGMSLVGVEIITNGSASHHEFQKLGKRIELIREATLKCGGVYLYANQQGCDGERTYYDGSALIIINGNVIAQSSQFSILDVEVISATVDIEEVQTYRASIVSRGLQASEAEQYPVIVLDLPGESDSDKKLSQPVNVNYLSPSEEIKFGPACWLWDYLRRSKQNGFFLPLSGGIDSCSTALIVFSMCEMLYDQIEANSMDS